jgi:hypothetical protein
MVSIKEDGFASWLWRPKWLVLKEQTLTIHKTEVCTMFTMDNVCLRLAIARLSGRGAFAQPRYPLILDVGLCAAAVNRVAMSFVLRVRGSRITS